MVESARGPRLLYSLGAFLAGCMLAAQAGFNARLGLVAQSTLLAATSASLTAFLCVAGLWVLLRRSPIRVAAVPPYLWVLGGLLGALAVTGVYWLVPKLGISTVVTLVLAGQLVTSLVAGHMGWFGLPRSRFDSNKLWGASTLLAGALVVTYG